MTSTDTYHHGNLRRELMDGALAVIRERGLEGLSLREVASAAGVSTAAPYHHFVDKGALVRSLGYEALRTLDEAMAEAETSAGPDALDKLLAIGEAYVAFALEHRDYYAVMRSREMAEPHAPEEVEEHGETWERLVRAVAACQASGQLPAGDTVVSAVGMWSLVHGLADLCTSGPVLAMPQAAAGPSAFVASVLRSVIAFGGAAPAATDGTDLGGIS